MKEKILNYLRMKGKMSVSTREIARDLEFDAAGFRKLAKVLSTMESEKLIEFTGFGTVQLKNFGSALSGVFHANARGFGFVSIDEEDEDVFIGKGKTSFAMDGDTVEIELTKNANSLTGVAAEGVVTKIIKHSVDILVGKFTANNEIENFIGYVSLKNKKLPEKVLISTSGLIAVTDDIVKIDVIQFIDKKHPIMQGLITKIIGHDGDKGIDVLEILEGMGIRSEFPKEVLAQAEATEEKISDVELRGREDFRKEITYTIDGADSKDLDDAIHVKILSNGNFELGVHIADVSHYVEENSALDVEALERGTSTYVTDRVVPMLPERLSNGICSLNPEVDRLTQSCVMEIDHQGRIVKHRIVQSVIRTTYRMTYDDVNLIIAGDKSTGVLFPKIVSSVENAVNLHESLERMRHNRGALDFVTTESKILVDENGVPTEITKRERGIAERMIESFMLAANETVARHFAEKSLPFIYRIHEHPKAEKLTTFIEFAQVLGVSFKGTAQHVEQQDLQKFMQAIQGREGEEVLSMMLLRSMQQARYSEKNLGHFGLAAKYYTHFTSPIRRYPDLLVHRLIRQYAMSTDEKIQEYWKERIPELAQQASSRERRSVDAERNVEKIKKAEYMIQFVGEELTGTVASVTSFGMFIELPDTIEGLIHISTLKKDYFTFNPRALTMVGKRTGLIFKVGQSIKVKVVRADKITGDIDFEYLPSADDKFEKSSIKNKRSRQSSVNNKRTEKISEKFGNNKKIQQPYYKKAAKGKFTKSDRRIGKGDGARGKKRGR